MKLRLDFTPVVSTYIEGPEAVPKQRDLDSALGELMKRRWIPPSLKSVRVSLISSAYCFCTYQEVLGQEIHQARSITKLTVKKARKESGVQEVLDRGTAMHKTLLPTKKDLAEPSGFQSVIGRIPAELRDVKGLKAVAESKVKVEGVERVQRGHISEDLEQWHRAFSNRAKEVVKFRELALWAPRGSYRVTGHPDMLFVFRGQILAMAELKTITRPLGGKVPDGKYWALQRALYRTMAQRLFGQTSPFPYYRVVVSQNAKTPPVVAVEEHAFHEQLGPVVDSVISAWAGQSEHWTSLDDCRWCFLANYCPRAVGENGRLLNPPGKSVLDLVIDVKKRDGEPVDHERLQRYMARQNSPEPRNLVSFARGCFD